MSDENRFHIGKPTAMTSAPEPPIDEAHLDRITGSDEAQKVEVLALFAFEAPRLLEQARSAGNGKTRRERLGALERLARNIGAVRLAENARREAGGSGAGLGMAALREDIQVVLAYIGSSPGDGA